MSVRALLVNVTGHVLHVERFGRHEHLVTEDHARVATRYENAVHTTAATTSMATPKPGEAIVLVDVTISGEKITSGVITLKWTDGTDEEGIESIQVNDGVANIHIAYAGRNKGWKNARVDFITSTTNQDASVSLGFYRVRGKGVLTHANWIAERDER